MEDYNFKTIREGLTSKLAAISTWAGQANAHDMQLLSQAARDLTQALLNLNELRRQ